MKHKSIQLQYEGFLKTAFLWKNNAVFELQQFEIPLAFKRFKTIIDPKLRLGKHIERFVSFQLEQEENITIIAENIQIQQDKITLGELDCIITKDTIPIHLEITYKFYVYDNSIGNTEIEHLIGPNNKDSLIKKLIKLKETQLPLIHSNECKHFLKQKDIDSRKIQQQVYFKAQVFIPLKEKVSFKILNNDCIRGFYIRNNELEIFKECRFFIPQKKDWLIEPIAAVNWITFDCFTETSQEYLLRKFSPLCWLKKPSGVLEKFFMLWW